MRCSLSLFLAPFADATFVTSLFPFLLLMCVCVLAWHLACTIRSVRMCVYLVIWFFALFWCCFVMYITIARRDA